MFSLTRFAPADAPAQWELLKAYPVRIVSVLWQTLVQQWMGLGEQLVGKLGWLDTRLPPSFIFIAAGVLVLTFMSTTAGRARRPWLPAAAVFGGILIMCVSLYFARTAPGFPEVAGLQGRYFLPFAAAFALAFPCLPALGRRILPFAAIGLAVLALSGPVVVIRTLVVRYYLSAG
jgi:uncharacterized membrane protein